MDTPGLCVYRFGRTSRTHNASRLHTFYCTLSPALLPRCVSLAGLPLLSAAFWTHRSTIRAHLRTPAVAIFATPPQNDITLSLFAWIIGLSRTHTAPHFATDHAVVTVSPFTSSLWDSRSALLHGFLTWFFTTPAMPLLYALGSLHYTRLPTTCVPLAAAQHCCTATFHWCTVLPVRFRTPAIRYGCALSGSAFTTLHTAISSERFGHRHAVC